MNKVLYVILAALCLVSCSSYDIKGTTDSQHLDGNWLYLRVTEKDDVKTIDSCEVVHGEFKFCGGFDSTRVATICTADEAILPVVLEKGEIKVVLNNADQSCTGTELNDTLNSFMHAFNKIQNSLFDLQKELQQLEYNVVTQVEANPDSVSKAISDKGVNLTKELEDLFTNFVTKNYNNVLGPYVFLLKATADTGGIPLLSPWVQQILSKAPASFKNDLNVQQYISLAQKNKNIENGTEQPDQAPLQNNGAIPPAVGNTATPADLGGTSKGAAKDSVK